MQHIGQTVYVTTIDYKDLGLCLYGVSISEHEGYIAILNEKKRRSMIQNMI